MFLVRMELFIDNQRADLDERSVVSVTLSVASVTDPEYGRTGYTKNVTIPMTAANRWLMGAGAMPSASSVRARNGPIMPHATVCPPSFPITQRCSAPV